MLLTSVCCALRPQITRHTAGCSTARPPLLSSDHSGAASRTLEPTTMLVFTQAWWRAPEHGHPVGSVTVTLCSYALGRAPKHDHPVGMHSKCSLVTGNQRTVLLSRLLYTWCQLPMRKPKRPRAILPDMHARGLSLGRFHEQGKAVIRTIPRQIR